MYKLENNTHSAIEIISSTIYKSFLFDFYIDQLYWLSDKNPPRNQANAYFFCIDQVINSYVRLIKSLIGSCVRTFLC